MERSRAVAAAGKSPGTSPWMGVALIGLGLTFRILLDTAGQVTRQYLVQGTPANLVIDAEGVIVDRRLG